MRAVVVALLVFACSGSPTGACHDSVLVPGSYQVKLSDESRIEGGSVELRLDLHCTSAEERSPRTCSRASTGRPGIRHGLGACAVEDRATREDEGLARRIRRIRPLHPGDPAGHRTACFDGAVAEKVLSNLAIRVEGQRVDDRHPVWNPVVRPVLPRPAWRWMPARANPSLAPIP